jgi:hypothetical protein
MVETGTVSIGTEAVMLIQYSHFSSVSKAVPTLSVTLHIIETGYM